MPETNTPDVLIDTRPALSATSDMPAVEAPAATETAADAATETVTEQAAAVETADTETVEGAEAAAEADADARPEPGKKRPGVHQTLYEQRQRIREGDEKLAKAIAAAEQATEAAQRAAEAAEAIRKAQEKTPEQIAQEQAALDPRPSRDQFSDPDAYDEALAEWGGRKALRAEGVKAANEAAEKAAADAEADKGKTEEQKRSDDIAAQQKVITDRWQTEQEKVEAEHDDFLKTTLENPDFRVSEGVGVMLLNSDNGPQALYALGKDPAEAARLSAITDPIRLAMEFGKFTAKLEAPKATAPKLPAPITPVNSRGSATEPDLYKIGNEGSTEEYAARRMAMPDMQRRPGGTLGPVGRA